MHASLALAASLAAGVLALPPRRIGTTVTENSGRLSVRQIRNSRFAQRHGPVAVAKAYTKFGAEPPQDVLAAVESILESLGVDLDLLGRDTGSVKATPAQYDVEYLSPVSIGTPAQTLNLDFDTGSSDLWVFSSETPKNSVNGQTVYDPSKSSTSKKVSGASWSISYGDGSTSSGDVYTDVVNIGGLSVKAQAVEAAQKVSDEFTQESDLDGLLGLAFSSINTVKPQAQKTFFDSALENLDAPVFTADLKAGKPGKYNFGYIDNSSFTGPITYTDVDSSDGFWMFDSPAFAIGNGSKTSSAVSGIADTGTTLLMLPDEVVTAYYKKFDGAQYDSSQGGYTFPCSATPPSFTYYIEEAKITIPGEYMNFAPTDSSNKTCFGGIQSDQGIGFSIYGDVALKAAFVVFDGSDTPRLGFAAKDL